MLPRPAPISSVSDLLIPAPALFVAWVLSIICACSVETDMAQARAAIGSIFIFGFLSPGGIH
jgi:hypothetical protein